MSKEAKKIKELKFAVYIANISNDYCFIHAIFRFWVLVTFGDKVTKIQKYYVINSGSFVQRQKWIAIYHVKKFVKDSQL